MTRAEAAFTLRVSKALLAPLLALLWLAGGSVLAQTQTCATNGGTRGANAFALNGTFGSLPASPTPAVLPPVSQPLVAGRTTLTYLPSGFLQDGQYRISNRSNPNTNGTVNGDWWNVGDHDTDPNATGSVTPATGLMMVVNASIAPSVFYEETVTVAPNTNYEFSAWLLHNNIPSGPYFRSIGALPKPYNISFEVERVGVDPPGVGTVIASTGPVGATATPQWRNYGTLFNSGNATQLIFRFRNNGPGGAGNDLSLDDIVVAPCSLPSGNVSGTLYTDQNANGVFDPGADAPLPAGIDVQLVNASGQIVAQSQTDASGKYAFNGVPLGAYTVRVVTTNPNIPPGATPTAPASASYTGVVVTANTTDVRNFGFQNPRLGVAKTITSSTQTGPTAYAITYSNIVQNTGPVNVPKVQAVENLIRTFSPVPAANISVSGLALGAGSAGACVLNTGFTGKGNNTLLDGNGTLTPGQQCVIAYTVTVDVGANPGPFNNSVYASGFVGGGPNPGQTVPDGPASPPTPPAGTVAPATSSNGTNPTAPSSPTPFTPSKQQIGAAKAVSSVTQVGAGVFDVRYLLTVKNYGKVPATNVQVTDSLATTFPAPATFAVQGAPTVSGGLTANNAAYNGNSDTKLLAGNQTLLVNGSATVEFTVRVTTNGAAGPFNNSAVVSAANTPGGPPIWTDTSTDGTNPDPNGNGNPSDPGEDAPTPVGLPPRVLGLAKEVVPNSAKVVSPGVFEVSFLLTYKNLGAIPATNVQITDDLEATFPSPVTFVVTALPNTNGGLNPNPGYDGITDTRLLVGNQSLAAGQSGTVTLTVRVTQNGTTGPYNNSATVTSALTPGGPPVSTDLSDDGTNPDPGGDGNPSGPGKDDPTPVNAPVLTGVLRLTKVATNQTVKIGGTAGWILTATNTSATAVRGFKATDTLPVGLLYIDGSSTLDGVAIADPAATAVGAQQKLVWNLPDLAPGQTVTLKLSTRVTAAARSPLQNLALAGGQIGPPGSPTTVSSTTAAAAVTIDPGVFSDKAVTVGRVYFDKDGDNNYKEGTDIPIQGARVYLSNGRFAVSDDKGRYSLTEVEPGLWAIRVDRITAPYVLKPVPDDQGKRGTRYVRINTGGGIYNEDFLFGPPGSDTAKVRSTKVRVGKVSLEKVVSKVGGGYTITLKLNVGTRVQNLKITDPLPPGGTRASVTGTPTPTVSANVITLPGTLEPGNYTLSYTLSGNVPLERLVTDPDLSFDEVTR